VLGPCVEMEAWRRWCVDLAGPESRARVMEAAGRVSSSTDEEPAWDGSLDSPNMFLQQLDARFVVQALLAAADQGWRIA
jgi:hypothetical protein